MKEQLLKNTLIIGFGRVFTQFLSILLLPIYTSFLSPQEYGTADIIISYAALTLPLVTLGIEQGAFRYLVDLRNDEKGKAKVLSFAVLLPLVLLAVIGTTAFVIGTTLHVDVIGLAVIYAIFNSMLNVCLWLVRGMGDNMAYSLGSVLVGTVTLISGILSVVVFDMGINGMLGSVILANIVGVLFFAIKLKLIRYVRYRNIDPVLNKQIISYSLPLVPNGISWWLVNSLDRTVIAVALGAASVGVFSVASKFPVILISLFSIFWISWHESASLHIDSDEKDTFFSKVTNASVSLFTIIGLGLLTVLSLLFDHVVGDEFADAYMYIPILMLGSVFSIVATLYGSIYAAKKKTKYILTTTLLAAVVSVVVVLSLINVIGIYAATASSVLSYMTMMILRHYDIRKYVTITIDWGRILLLVVISTVVVIVYYANIPVLNILNLFFVLIVGLILNKVIILSLKDMLWKKRVKS